MFTVAITGRIQINIYLIFLQRTIKLCVKLNNTGFVGRGTWYKKIPVPDSFMAQYRYLLDRYGYHFVDVELTKPYLKKF